MTHYLFVDLKKKVQLNTYVRVDSYNMTMIKVKLSSKCKCAMNIENKNIENQIS